ncbi:MAG: tyrosine-type recombinase/integrase [Candidatus Xenobia bacterium]
MRVSEMVGLNVSDVVTRDGQLRERFYLRPEIAKGHRDDGWVSLNTLARKAVSEVLAFNQRYGYSVAPGSPLFVTRKHTRMSARSVQALVQQLRERADLGVPATPHTLRHSFITNLAQRCGNLTLVQQTARHRRLNTAGLRPPVRARSCRRGRAAGVGQAEGPPGLTPWRAQPKRPPRRCRNRV